MHTFQILRLARLSLSLVFIFIVVAMLRTPRAMAQAANAGTVTTASGTVQIQRGAATIPVTQGMPVQVGDRIITGDDGHIVVTLTDQSTLELGDSSNMVVEQHAGSATRVNLFGGVVRSFANKTIGAAAPNFEVHTPNAVAAVRGTRFDTAYFANITRPTFGDAHQFTDVSCHEGLVHVANAANPAGGVNCPAGYETTVAGTADPTNPGPLGMTGAVSFGAGGGNNVGGNTILSPVSGVPPPGCPTCTGPSESPPPPPPPGR